jgi:hypothetical protein
MHRFAAREMWFCATGGPPVRMNEPIPGAISQGMWLVARALADDGGNAHFA